MYLNWPEVGEEPGAGCGTVDEFGGGGGGWCVWFWALEAAWAAAAAASWPRRRSISMSCVYSVVS